MLELLTMDNMVEIVNSNMIWAFASIGLVGYILKRGDKREDNLVLLQEQYREESREREQALMSHINASNNTQLQIVSTLDNVQVALTNLQSSFDNLDKRVSKIEDKK